VAIDQHGLSFRLASQVYSMPRLDRRGYLPLSAALSGAALQVRIIRCRPQLTHLKENMAHAAQARGRCCCRAMSLPVRTTQRLRRASHHRFFCRVFYCANPQLSTSGHDVAFRFREIDCSFLSLNEAEPPRTGISAPADTSLLPVFWHSFPPPSVRKLRRA